MPRGSDKSGGGSGGGRLYSGNHSAFTLVSSVFEGTSAGGSAANSSAVVSLTQQLRQQTDGGGSQWLPSHHHSPFTMWGDPMGSNAGAATGQPQAMVSQPVRELLDELCCKFLVNINEENRGDMTCLLFQAEQAYWHYIDFYQEESPHLYPAYSLNTFCHILFNQYPELMGEQDVSQVMREWKRYKSQVPTCGAIIVDNTLHFCLLVQGYTSRVSWGFPKGKIQTGETNEQCAIREVLEETGIDLTSHLVSGDCIERLMHDRMVTLYVVTGISKDTRFQAKTKNEIKEYGWFKIQDLPGNKTDTVAAEKLGGLKPDAFALAMPFLKPLKKILKNKLAASVRPQTTNATGQKKQKKGKASASARLHREPVVTPGGAGGNAHVSSDDYCDELHAIFGIRKDGPVVADVTQQRGTVGSLPATGSIQKAAQPEQDVTRSGVTGASEAATGGQELGLGKSDLILRRLQGDLQQLDNNLLTRISSIIDDHRRERLLACQRVLSQLNVRKYLTKDPPIAM